MKEQFEKLHDTSVDRLYDVTTGYKNQNNICDFIVYRNGNLNYFECKSVHGNTLNFKSDIRANQWRGLLKKSCISGVNAGIICWFIDHDITIYLPIEDLQYLLQEGNKSFNILKDKEKILATEIIGTKRKIFFDYDLDHFLKEIEYE
jgi:penicillin-binding protein-related factor A (putative recombinase)